MFLTAFLVFATVIILFLGIIWGRGSWDNVLLKMVLVGGGIWGIIEVLLHFGFVFRSSGG